MVVAQLYFNYSFRFNKNTKRLIHMKQFLFIILTVNSYDAFALEIAHFRRLSIITREESVATSHCHLVPIYACPCDASWGLHDFQKIEWEKMLSTNQRLGKSPWEPITSHVKHGLLMKRSKQWDTQHLLGHCCWCGVHTQCCAEMKLSHDKRSGGLFVHFFKNGNIARRSS